MENFGNPITGYTTAYYEMIIESQSIATSNFVEYNLSHTEDTDYCNRNFSDNYRLNQHRSNVSKDKSNISSTKGLVSRQRGLAAKVSSQRDTSFDRTLSKSNLKSNKSQKRRSIR